MAVVLLEDIDDPIVSRIEERCFIELFDTVLMSINRNRATADEISAGIENIIAYFRERGPPDACAAANFRTLGDSLGYFYWSSPLSAGVTRKKALAAIRNCPEFRSCFNQSSLKVVSVGGGTGSDLVGLYSALYEGRSTFENMEITLADSNSQWFPYHKAVEACLHEEIFGKASELIQSRNINTSFVCADLGNSLPANLQQEIRNANLVWMKGLRSILSGDYERIRVTENVISSMTPGSLFVVLDPLFYDDFDIFRNKLQRIFSTNVGHKYELYLFPERFRFRFATSTNQEIIIFKRI
ncbi:uncharacterized protein LOC129988835 [Argiope bruennichi]|uniref:uncharacterized protein LOC129988835 n=1 Tax=Argiope bruennichi TaxID=94029 RepID=UPI002494B679|nr:uncharacterized protein LOC129988835 [Argiope bruennichi]